MFLPVPLLRIIWFYINYHVLLLSSFTGGLAIAVPGDIKGYYEAYKDHGELPWKRLFEPSIKLARYGFTVTDDLGGAIASREEAVRNTPNMRYLLIM